MFQMKKVMEVGEEMARWKKAVRGHVLHLVLFAKAGELLLGLAEQVEAAKEVHDMERTFTRYNV